MSGVQQILAKNTVTVFSKSWCPYCTRVKGLFGSLNLTVPYEEVELDKRADGAALESELREMTKSTSVPKVFIKDKFIGGCDDAHALHKAGKLLPQINAASSL